MPRKYIAIQYDDETSEKLRNWAASNGFDLSVKFSGEKQDPNDFDFHTTVFYSSNESNLEDGLYSVEKTPIEIVGFDMLGPDKNVPVLKVTGLDLLLLRKFYAERYGLVDEWPEYKPHVSLSYSRNNLPDISGLLLPDFVLYYDKVKIRDVKE